jgi:hypothetical protein
MPGAGSQRTYTTFEVSNSLFEYVSGGIHDTRIDIAAFLQREKPGCMISILKDI